jgi:hypothetical protein
MKKRLILTSLFLIANIVTLFAQGTPACGGADIDDTPCPIDSWVVVFAAGVLIVTLLHLQRKKAAFPISKS